VNRACVRDRGAGRDDRETNQVTLEPVESSGIRFGQRKNGRRIIDAGSDRTMEFCTRVRPFAFSFCRYAGEDCRMSVAGGDRHA